MWTEVVFDGGTDDEREAVLAAHEAYVDANARFDWPSLPGRWSDDPTATFFNLNGHTYVGLEHWTRLWKYYRERLETGRWEPFDVKLIIRGDLALLTCHRNTSVRWIGLESAPPGFDERAFVSRATMAFLRADGEWRIYHVHFSEANDGPRPGGI